jgi:hypothetical protein
LLGKEPLKLMFILLAACPFQRQGGARLQYRNTLQQTVDMNVGRHVRGSELASQARLLRRQACGLTPELAQPSFERGKNLLHRKPLLMTWCNIDTRQLPAL